MECCILICANKVDLPPERWAVSREMFTNFAKSTGYPLLETSASSGCNINEVNNKYAIDVHLIEVRC